MNYDPWGTPESGSVPTFGFTGELQDSATGLVNLRARWYSTTRGTFTAHRWRTDESDDTAPYSHHGYAYALSNPVLYSDPTGKFACDPQIFGATWSPSITTLNNDYNDYCNSQRVRMNQVLHVSNPTMVIQHNAAGSLVYLFTDLDLPGGSGSKAQQMRQNNLSEAAERLEFVLWYTSSGSARHFGIPFDDSGFRKELQDSLVWGKNPPSNQVGHFLTAVDAGYNSWGDWRDYFGKSCIVGHEKLGDYQGSQGPGRYWHYMIQCDMGGTTDDINSFDAAVQADEKGNYELRDCLISEILPDLPEIFDRNKPEYQNRRGNSRQDLRLSIKGWIFGNMIKDRRIRDLNGAQSWLRTNIVE